MPFYKVPQPVHASSSGTVQQQQGQQQGQLMQEQLMQGQQQGKQQLQQRIWDSTSGLYKETSIPDGCGRGIVPGLVVPSPSDDLEDWSIRSTISDRSSSFADMTEVDRDSELLRRDLEHQIQRQTYGDNTSKKDSEITSKGRPRPKSCLIEQELEELRRRENEVSAMHQSLYHSQQMLSDPSSYPGDVTDKDSGISEDNNVEYSNRSHPASAGESRIVQELTEQRLRELELRGRWKQMGLIADNDDEEQIEPRQDPVVDGNRKQRPTAIVQPEVNRGIEQSRVHPFVGNEQFMENRMSYIPVEETPIEREIRMAREREEALRRSRGLPTTITSGTATGSTVNGREEETLKIEITPLDDAAIDGFQVAPSKMSMKKLANNRLQMEIQREKKREVALRTQGAIHTISEERAGEHKKYVEIIPPDCNQNSAKTFPCWMKNSNSKNSNLAESDAQLDGSGDSIVEGMNCSMSKDNPIKLGGAGVDRSDRGVTGKVRMNKQTIQDEHDRVLAEMNELAMRSRSLKSKSNSSEPPSAAERKMERELREMQNREEELRLQREMLNQGHPID